MKIATWNVNSLRARKDHVCQWLSAAAPDILGLQETKVTDDLFPVDDFRAMGYHAAFSGQKAYNGVAVLSRAPCRDVVTDIPALDDHQRRILDATVGDIRVVNVYVPNGKAVNAPEFDYKLDWLKKLTRHVKNQLKAHPRLVVLGDINIAPEARDVHDPELWAGQVLFSETERQAFQDLLAIGLTDAFRLFDQAEKSFSWWDYRMQGFRRNHGLRIDHILTSAALSEHCTSCVIDKAPRKWERPSDHAPVIAEFTP
jgi:exodeoxyribonuclease-3